MKNLAFLLAIIGCQAIYSQNNANYILIVNGDSLKISLNSPFEYKTATGETLNMEVIQPGILSYSDKFVSFQYEKEHNISNAKIEEDIEQLMVMKSTGSGFMVQKYGSIDPSILTDFLLNEVTKESINYGYEKFEEPFLKTLKGGHVVEGTKATLTYKGETEIYVVAAYGAKDEGIIILTMLLNDEFTEPDSKMIDMFWDTLVINLKEN